MSEKSALEALREDVSARARAYLDRACELIDFPGDAESLGEFLDRSNVRARAVEAAVDLLAELLCMTPR